jgi:hypothetical protein
MSDLTSGHHAPQTDLIAPFDAFPAEVDGRTVWQAKDFQERPDTWQRPLTAEEISELSTAADAFAAKGLPLTAMSKATFRLSGTFEAFLASVRDELINGRGFILFKGFPTTDWSIEKIAAAYMGLGAHLGEFVSQNGKGHVLGHVKDIGNDPTQIDKVRIYSTNAKQFFHTDTCDLVGLLCLHRAKEGGESDIASSHHLYNCLRKERPDVLETLTQPIWYMDRKGEFSDGQQPYFKAAVFYYHQGRVILHWDPYYARSLERFWSTGELPPLSDKFVIALRRQPLIPHGRQREAMKVLEDIATREALHMVLEVGDVQFVSCNHVLHAVCSLFARAMGADR